MKHAFLRRLGALALALAMAASLCVTPAWAAPGDPELDTRIIILNGTSVNDTYTLKVKNANLNDKISWTPSPGVRVSWTGSTVIEDSDGNLTNDYVTVGASSLTTATNPGTVQVQVSRGSGSFDTVTCYVYCGAAPITAPTSIPALEVGKSYQLEITIDDHGDLFDVGDFTFDPGLSGSVRVGALSITDYEDGKKKLIVPLTGMAKGNPTLTMTMKGGYTKSWDLTVKESTDVLIREMWVDPDNLSLTVGDTYDRLTISQFLPPNPTNKKVTWSSNRTDIVTVDPSTGVVKAVGAGDAIITAAAQDNSGVTAICKVTVKETTSNLKLDATSKTLYTYGGPSTSDTPKNFTLTAIPGGENHDNVSYEWTGYNKNIVTVVAGANGTAIVTAQKAGSTTITARATFYDKPTWDQTRKVTATRTATCAISVLDKDSVAVTGVTLNKKEHTMPADGTVTLSVTSITPPHAPVKTVKWESSDPTIAEVDQNGKVTAHKAGYVSITARPEFGNTRGGVCVITVTPKAESINLRGVSSSFDYNTQGTNHYGYTFGNPRDELKVRAVFTPTAAADPVRWAIKKDADTSVATVSSGTTTQATITAVSPGETTITAVPMDPAGKDRELSAGPAEVKVTVSGLTIQQTVDGTTSTITSLNLAEGRRQTVTFKAFGSADTGGTSCDWSISDPSIVMIGSKTGASTTLTARRPGTVTLTARRGSYSATCTVTVGEDTAVTITASTPPGSPLQFSSLAGQLQSACSSKTGSPLSYITNLAVASTDQGILHDQHHSSADTGAGVGAQDRYYPGTAPQGQRSMNDLSFVPRNTFSGTAEITYTGWSTKNQSFNGTIRVTVNGTGDVMYSSSEGAPVTFLADDFNLYHPNLSAVSFTPPLDSVGTLYYNYTSPAQPGTKVSSGTTYSRTGNPSLDRVTFVPAAGYTGTVRISYKGTDTGKRSFTGVVTITVNGGGSAGATTDIYYPMKEDGWVTFKAADFNTASRNTLGESLSYVRFSLPPSNEGTLFYNYRGFSNYDSAVASTTSYYYSGTPSLSGVSFVPTTTTPGQVDIDYTGYTVKGNTFTGTIHLGQDPSAPEQNNGMRYTVFTGRSVSFSTNNFNTACVAATGASLDYVQFTQMPAVGQGTLRYTRGNSSGNYNVATSTRCYRSAPNSWDVQLSNVYFQANANYTGTVTLPFVGYNTNGTSFTGEVTIEVTPPAAADITFTGTTASPYRLSAYLVRNACIGALDGTLSYITFTSLPSASAGRLYSGYNGFRTGSQVNTGTRYYASGTPGIDQLSFVPRGRYSGQVTIGFTAANTSGQSVSGRIVLNLSSNGSSSYFSDLIYHTWAAPAVDYLYLNGVTKGVTATAFGPNQQINRCDFVLMLCRAFQFSETGGYSFADVPTDAYFAGAVAAAKQRGIVSGDGANFRPYGKLTRQDAMVMIKNALDAAGWSVNATSTSILNQFSDGATVSAYARNAVSALVQLGAVNGDNGRLLPHNPITRAEAAVILHFVMTM